VAEEMDNTDQAENVSGSILELESSLPDAEPERIGFGKRLGALILDGIFTAISAGVIGYALKDLFVGLAPADPDLGEMGGLYVAITGAAGICAVLYGLIEGFTGASPGKMILAIKIGTENSMSANTNTLLTRYAIKTSASIVSLVGIILGVEILSSLSVVASVIITIGCFFALGAAKQALHDKIAHTAVYPEETIP
jgi:uncharacterized RDD family membrane protein YckC